MLDLEGALSALNQFDQRSGSTLKEVYLEIKRDLHFYQPSEFYEILACLDKSK